MAHKSTLNTFSRNFLMSFVFFVNLFVVKSDVVLTAFHFLICLAVQSNSPNRLETKCDSRIKM